MTSCVVCTVHMKMRSASFLVEPQNQSLRFISGLASKPVVTFSPGLALKSVTIVSSGLGLKIGSSGLMIWASKSPR
jgi:hypothetical protein